MVDCFKKQGDAVEWLGPVVQPKDWVSKLKRYAYRGFFQKRFLPGRVPARLKNNSHQIARNMEGQHFDIVFSPGTLELAHLECREPLVFWTDATFAGMINFYRAWTNLAQESIRDGNSAEQSALEKCKLAIYSSEWAAKSALQNYRVDPAKVKVVPFGANLECARTQQEIDQIVCQRRPRPCKLLFLGIDWVRKGGPMALDVVKKLNDIGFPSELTIVGCNPPNLKALPPFVHTLGFISKSTKEGKQRIDQLLQEAHFLIMPSIAECTPIAFCEANSFGLPCLATDVGGIPSVISNGVNGMTFGLHAKPDEYCNFILSILNSTQEYRNLALSSFNEYQTRLNWQVAGRTVKKLVQDFVL